MEIKITPKALNDASSDFVESKNTPARAARFSLKFESAIEKLAVIDVQFALCSHPVLATLNYRAAILMIG